jgi:hypothetical protein
MLVAKGVPGSKLPFIDTIAMYVTEMKCLQQTRLRYSHVYLWWKTLLLQMVE